MRLLAFAAITAVATAGVGCKPGQVDLLGGCTGIRADVIDQEVAPPANVSMLIRVTDCDEHPLGRRLDPSAFEITEDGTKLSPDEATRKIVPAARQTSERTLFALDLSGSITRTGLRDMMVDAASRIAGRLLPKSSIAIYGFDGRSDLVPLTFFSNDPQAIDSAFSRARTEPPVDESTNLNGAVKNGLALLDRAVASDDKDPYTVAHGTMVVFTDGNDLAHRVDDDVVKNALDATPHSTFAIGVGQDTDPESLARIARTAHFAHASDPAIDDAFDRDGRTIEAQAEANYVVSYCSPSRAGKRKLAVTVQDGDNTAAIEIEFDSNGFGAGCSPSASTIR